MQVKKQQLEWHMEQWTVSRSGKEYVKAVYSHPAYLLYAEYIMRNAGLDEAKAEIKIAGRKINLGSILKSGDITLPTKVHLVNFK